MSRRWGVGAILVLAWSFEIAACSSARRAPPQSVSDPVWNVWAERSSSPVFRPENLQRGQDYSVVVNLAALKFRESQGNRVYSQDVAAPFAEWMSRHPELDAADIEVLVVPDGRYLQLLDQRTKVLTVDLKQARLVHDEGFTLDGSPFEVLRSHQGRAPFSFGMVSFRARVPKTAPLGNAPVALSFWVDGRPVDEVAVNLCVAADATTTCPTSQAAQEHTLRGADLADTGGPPGGALHVIERGNDVVGVFRCSHCQNGAYLTWTVGRQTAGWLSDRINELVQRLTPPLADQKRFLQEGDALHNLLFPDPQDPDGAEADRAFARFISTARSATAGAPPTSLFVRVLPNEPTLLLLPVGLMRVPLADGTKAYVGFSVNVESPLELQDYTVPQGCISNWVLFTPPPGEDLGEASTARAYANARGWLDSVAKTCPGCSYTDPGRFVEWLSGGAGTGQPVTGQALVVLSQYRNNSLFFDSAVDNPPSVPSASIRRRFGSPSFALLDACGTAAPGGSEFARSLNLHGVSTVLSTSAAISGSLGGHFLEAFMNEIREHPDYSVSRARFEAVKVVSRRKEREGRTYGEQALLFSLAGNGRLRLCPPAAAAPR